MSAQDRISANVLENLIGQHLGGADTTAAQGPALDAQAIAEFPPPNSKQSISKTMSTISPHKGGASSNAQFIGQATAYVWDVASDEIQWEDNAVEILSVRSGSRISSGTAFSLLVAAEHVTRRKKVFTTSYGEDLGSGVPYTLQYRFTPGGLRSLDTLWIEEQGRWWADDNGKPRHARGTIRVMDDSAGEPAADGLGNDHDELTGQLNRIRLTSALEAVIQRSETMGENSAFLIVAINNLAIINETFGFDVGDQVIASVAKILKSKLRGGDSIGRYSANKFGVILNDCGPGAMRVAAERLIKAVSHTSIMNSACPLSATLSIGGVLLPDHAETVNQALSRALEALGTAKSKRQDCFTAFESNLGRESERRRNIKVAEDVRAALEENRMFLMLQPIYRSDTREPAFHECLMRLRQKDGTVVSAGTFIEIAEQLGLSRQIDQRTLELAIAMLRADPDLHLSLNVSGLTCADHDWLLKLHKLTGQDRAVASRLIVEITETAAIHDLEQSIVFVDTLKEFGCRVAIDDFGAGYTSFKNLKHLPVDMVKIDGAFVKNLVHDKSDRVFLRTMVELSENFGLESVAEFVVDGPTADIAAGTGITYLQGFHLSEPLMPGEVSQLLQ